MKKLITAVLKNQTPEPAHIKQQEKVFKFISSHTYEN